MQDKEPLYVRHKKHALLVLRFLVAGVTGTAINLLVLYVLTEQLGFYYLLSVVVAFWFSFVISFILQKFWTFQDTATHRVKRQAFLYFVTATGNFFLNVGSMYVLVSWLHIWYIGAQMFTSGLIAIISFSVYRLAIFAHEHPLSVE